jgi:tRNA(adenine34) deaminase
MNKDEYFMKIALQEAALAAEKHEVPIGAVIVCSDQIIAKAHNQTEMLNDITAHAEMLALTAAMEAMSSKYLPDCCLYVTLEPCVMCSGAIGLSQIKRVVYAAKDSKRGYTRCQIPIFHKQTEVIRGVCEQAVQILQTFFKARR